MQLDLGDALYKSLATKQLADAAAHASEAQRQESVFAAVQAYFDLALAQAARGVSIDAFTISSNYHRQTIEAVNAGLTFKGDALRVAVEKERNQLASLQAREQQRVAAARLSQVLHLDPVIELEAQDSDLAPLSIIETNTALDSLVQQTFVTRPELRRNQSLVNAARESKNGTVYGPLIPSIGASGFFGGLGGGREGIPDTLGSQEDYAVGVAWRLGPGGLFDVTRVHAADARLRIEDHTMQKLRDDLTRQTVEAFAHWQAIREQIDSARRALEAAREGLRLAEQRKEFAVGIVLENIQAEQDLTRARLEYLRAVAAFNQAQYALRKAVGKL
jgi:outer membrane protein TolC